MIIGQGRVNWGFPVASRSICYLPMPKVEGYNIDLQDIDKSWYIVFGELSSFDQRACFVL